MKVEDLFEDIKDGVMLLSLLEVLSGEKLVSSVFCAVVPDVKNEILLCSPAFVKLSFCEYM